MDPAAAPSHAAPPLATVLAPPAFSVGGVIGKTFSTWSKNVVAFALLAAILKLPTFALNLLNTYSVYGGYPSFREMMKKGIEQRSAGVSQWTPLVTTAWALMVVVTFIELGAFTYGAIQHLAGRRPTVQALLGAGLRRALPVFLAGAMGGLLVMGGTILLVVPGVIAFCAASLAIPAVVAETKGPFDALRRSFALTRGHRFAIWLAFVVMTLVAWVAGLFVGVIPLALGGGTASLIGALASFVLSAIVTPLWTLLPAVAYHDLRIAKDGTDTAQLARVFE